MLTFLNFYKEMENLLENLGANPRGIAPNFPVNFPFFFKIEKS
jgi:hypothetical protein